MDSSKTGELIYRLRKEKGLTQKQLADMLNVSDRAVSKWERAQGLPDISLMSAISDIFGVELENILDGEMKVNDFVVGNMKKSKFYVCPYCGNITVSTGNVSLSCCGRRLEEAIPKKAEGENRLKVEKIENELFVSSDHPMNKEDYITFVAFLTGDCLHMVKKYPEWDFYLRIPGFKHGMIVWFSKKSGLLYENV